MPLALFCDSNIIKNRLIVLYSTLMLEYYFFTIDMFATKGLRLSLVLLLFITIVVLPTIFVVHLCPHDNLDEGWMWAHSFAYSDNGSRVHFTSNTFFT